MECFVIGQRRAPVVVTIARQSCTATQRHGGTGGVTDRAKECERCLGVTGTGLDLAEAVRDAAQQMKRHRLFCLRAELPPKPEGLLKEWSGPFPAFLGFLCQAQDVDGVRGDLHVVDRFGDVEGGTG